MPPTTEADGTDDVAVLGRTRGRVNAAPRTFVCARYDAIVVPAVAVVAGLVFLLAVIAPDAVATIAPKEGALEHVSHVALGVAAIGWVRRAFGPVAAWGGRAAVAAIAVLLVVALAEEIDYGEVYGFMPVAAVVRGAVGRPNLHNLGSGGSYLVFAAPLLLVVVAGLRPPVRDHGWRGPRRDGAIALSVCGAFALASVATPPAVERALDELSELLGYLVLAMLAWRPGPRTTPRLRTEARRRRGSAACRSWRR